MEDSLSYRIFRNCRPQRIFPTALSKYFDKRERIIWASVTRLHESKFVHFLLIEIFRSKRIF